MAKVIEPPTDGTKYPWSEWTDGKWRIATRGEDFSCNPKTFAAALYGYANRNNCKAETDLKSCKVNEVKFCITKIGKIKKGTKTKKASRKRK